MVQKDEFYSIIEKCADFLVKNKTLLKEIYFNHTSSMDITLRFRPDEIVTINIDTNHNVH